MKKFGLLCFCLTAILLAGCGKEKEDAQPDKGIDEAKIQIETSQGEESGQEEESQEPQPEAGQVVSYLTGEYVPEAIGRRRPIAVMLNNAKEGCPQSGIANAGVVYEAPTEGDITRLMGIFEDYDQLEKIGSIRSCRDYYIHYAQEFDSIYVHYGQAVYALPYLEQDFIHNINGISSVGDQVFYRTSDRKAPHNAYTSYQGIQTGIGLLGYDQNYGADYQGHYQFAVPGEEVTLTNPSPAQTVKLDCYSVNHPWFEYDAASGKYNRFQYGEAQIDELTGQQLQYDNIILEYASYQPYDENGYLNIDTTSGGQGKFITRGQAEDISWRKDSEWGVTRYYDGNGQEIQLNTGKTWVCIILNDKTSQITIA